MEDPARDVDPALHAAGKGLDQTPGPVGEAGPPQRPLDSLAKLGALQPIETAEGLEVLARGQVRVEGDLLRDEPELLSAAARGQQLVEHLDLARIGHRETADAPHEGRLAGTVRTEEGQPLSPPQLEAGAIQRGRASVPFGHIANAQRPIRGGGALTHLALALNHEDSTSIQGWRS